MNASLFPPAERTRSIAIQHSFSDDFDFHVCGGISLFAQVKIEVKCSHDMSIHLKRETTYIRLRSPISSDWGRVPRESDCHVFRARGFDDEVAASLKSRVADIKQQRYS